MMLKRMSRLKAIIKFFLVFACIETVGLGAPGYMDWLGSNGNTARNNYEAAKTKHFNAKQTLSSCRSGVRYKQSNSCNSESSAEFSARVNEENKKDEYIKALKDRISNLDTQINSSTNTAEKTKLTGYKNTATNELNAVSKIVSPHNPNKR